MRTLFGCANIEVRTGDGSGGWPEAARFDAILVAASGPRVPEVLRAQLVPGGRLVMPVDDGWVQRLVRATRPMIRTGKSSCATCASCR